MMKKGDHAIFQSDLYGGTFHAVTNELPRYGMDYTLVDASNPENFEKAIRPETRVIYIETPQTRRSRLPTSAQSPPSQKHMVLSPSSTTPLLPL